MLIDFFLVFFFCVLLSAPGSSGKGASTPLKRRRWELGSNVESERSVRRVTGEDGRSPCRPWDREDLMRRLATFKAMTWFGKPKVWIQSFSRSLSIR